MSRIAVSKRALVAAVAALVAFTLPLAVPAALAEPQMEDAAARTIVARLSALRPDLPIRRVAASPLEGIYEVEIAGGGMLYVTSDGRHLFAGDLFELRDDELVNLTERGREAGRGELIRAVDPETLIVFAADDEPRAVINVFTDIDCGYCRQLHRDVPRLNELGIEVRYLGYPRAGVGSSSYDKLMTAWCADDPHEAMTRLKLGEQLPVRTCPNPVADHYALGDRVGVTGTPSIVTPEGRMIPGYLPPEELAARLGVAVQ